MDRKTWTVVKFTEENCVEALPTTWIIPDRQQCYWPPFTNDKIQAAIKKHEEPNLTWPQYPIEFLRNSTYDNYSLARLKTKKAEDTSDLNSDVELTLKKRVPKRPKFFDSSDDDENNQLNIIPSHPSLKKTRIINSGSHSDIELEVEDGEILSQSFSQGNNQSSERVGGTEEFFVNQNNVQARGVDENAGPSIEHNTRHISDTTRYDVTDRNIKELLTQTHLLKSMVGEMSIKLDNFIKTNRTGSTAHQNEAEIDDSIYRKFQMPFTTLEQLDEFKKFISEENNFTRTVNEVMKNGGSTTYDFVKRSLQTIISNELASQFSYYGKKGKRQFSQTNLAKLIICTSDRGKFSINKKETEKAIQSWLKRSKERMKK